MQVYDHGGEFRGAVQDVMTTDVRAVASDESLERVLLILSRGMVVPVLHEGRFQGLITKIDVLNHLRLHPEKSST
jgi:cystathionine beta-synthase